MGNIPFCAFGCSLSVLSHLLAFWCVPFFLLGENMCMPPNSRVTVVVVLVSGVFLWFYSGFLLLAHGLEGNKGKHETKRAIKQ